MASLSLSTELAAVMLFGAGLAIAAPAPAAAQAVTCQTLRTKTICSDGSSYQMSGGKIFSPNGTTSQRSGNATTGSDRTSRMSANGSVCGQAGNATACN